jgi:hypothetical protein
MTKTTTTSTPTDDEFNSDDIFAKVPNIGDLCEGSATQIPTKEAGSEESSEQAEKEDYSEWGGEEYLLSIYDEIVFDNSYRENFTLRKLSFCFKTRSSEDMININVYLDRLSPKSMNTYQTYSNYFTLAASLRSFQNQDFSDKSIQQVYEYLRTLDSAIIDILLNQLSKFDIKVAKALEVGQKNF